MFCDKGLFLKLLFIIIYMYNEVESIKPRIDCVYNQYAYSRSSLGFYNTEFIPEDQCTHFIYSSVAINEANWIVKINNEYNDVVLNGFHNFTNLRQKQPDTKFLFTVRETFKHYVDMVAEKSQRDSFISSLVEFTKYYNFDGVELFWEVPVGTFTTTQYSKFKTDIVYFIQELRRAYDKENRNWEITLFASTFKNDVNNQFYVYELCNLVNAVHLKTFDLRSILTFTDVYAPLHRSQTNRETSSQTEYVVEAADNWSKRNCPPHKMLIGIPFYGRTYILDDINDHKLGAKSNGTVVKGQYVNVDGILPYFEICNYINNHGWTTDWDTEGLVPFAYKDKMWVSYDDEESIQNKLDWLKQRGFGGVYAYSIDFDDFRGICGPINPLINSIRANLQDYDVPVPATPPRQPPSWLRAPTTPAST